ncbi:MAG: SMP-30/gluconolactonase/LRE family protein [Candidatus Hydrogenedentes bacterium]|nr:SMP-30/gluconolactonase/LRE family protein [Candidatus Hydrogenedentota bacterium]
MKLSLRVAALLPALLLGYLFLWPVPIDPEAWQPPSAPSLTGLYAVNNALAGVTRLGEGVGPKPEDIAIDSQGRIYGGFEDGRIMRWDPSGQHPELFVDTGGRPLGLHFDADENLVVADSLKGLIRVAPDGTTTVLSTEQGGLPYGFTDDVDIGADGSIYFSDASHKFGQTQFMEDLIEHGPNGRLLVWHPESGQAELLLDGLYFANGIAVDPDQQFVLVNETGSYRVRKYWIAGPKKGRDEVIINNLPGFPDGISAGSNGVFWIALASPRNGLMDKLGPKPFLRKVVMRLPAFLRPKPVQYSFVVGIDADGKVLHNLQDPDGAYAPITSVQEHEGMLYFGSIVESAFARIAVPETDGRAVK